MSTLRERLGHGERRSRVVDDALEVLELEVKDKSGLSGLAVKGAYALVKGIRPNFLRQVVDHLLDEFLDALEPFVAEAKDSGVGVGTLVRKKGGEVAEALLKITDRKAKNAENKVIQKTYDKLRPTAEKHVEAAAPRLGDLLAKHAAD